MYNILTSMELAGLLLLLIFSWIAGSKASRLVYHQNADLMKRKARKQLFWAGYLIVIAGGTLAAIVLMMQQFDPIFWKDRAFLHAPLIVVPVLSILFISVPKLARLHKEAKAAADPIVAPSTRRLAADPGAIVPFQAAALGALAAFYLAFAAPVPMQWHHLLPTALFIVTVVGLWIRHDRRQQKVSRSEEAIVFRRSVIWLKNAAVMLVIVAAGGGLFYIGQQNSRLPDELDMMSGPHDYGGGAAIGHDHHAQHTAGKVTAAVPVTQLSGPRAGVPDRTFTLTAEKKTVRLSSGKSVDAWTFNGQIPGPELRMKEGELIEVTLINKDIDQGATIHWHGLDVPNAEDGVAGVTQDAVMPGERHTYRFVAKQTGSFWYHSHQHSKEAVQKGLFGPLIVEPAAGTNPKVEDITVMTHLWQGTFAVGANDSVERRAITPGTSVRLRLVNTDDWIRQKFLLTGTPFQVSAVDGTDLHQPEALENTILELTTGGRYDVSFVMPEHPVFLQVGGSNKLGLFMSPDGKGDIPKAALRNMAKFNPAQYGAAGTPPFNADSVFDRHFTMILDNKFGFYNGQFTNLYTINGEVFPNTPMFMVSEGDLVKTTIVNRGSVDHPMHLHGHHMLVLSYNGKPVKGTWWSDTLDVLPGDTYEVAFLADNPGVWMDHCHNLTHAVVGMSMHLAYEGVTTPFKVGRATENHPE